ncbi:GNAT family N-acetyltransferase [Actinokineospora enzanensis]|uniref:GNAT family N-acetyltransferase n=1 Tax=Actinokineospora enzanensis TaxID=155975 RepID=UPI0004775F21|nr:GNAT family protein [Actinokineospora enzanensis]
MSSLWTGTKVWLRGVEPEDWQTFRSFDEHSDDMRAGDRVHPPLSSEGYRRVTVERSVRTTPENMHLSIVSVADGQVVGGLNTHSVDRRSGRFQYGIGVGRAHRRHGYAAEAIGILLTYMFGEERFHKCEVKVYGFNESSIALHRALGFREEGVLRDHEFFGGRHHDVVLFGLTLSDYLDRWEFPEV